VDRIISISTVAYDGYPLVRAFESISRIGASHVEPAFIKGYMDPFEEDLFTPSYARELRRQITEAGLGCRVFSSHLDLGEEGVVEIFKRRMDFAGELGAEIIISNASSRAREEMFMNHIARLISEAASRKMIIALENPGGGRADLLDRGRDGAGLIRRIDSPWVRLNYDFGNVISHWNEKVRPEEDFEPARAHAVHLHLKDVTRVEQGWVYTEIGSGMIEYLGILQNLRSSSLPLSLEIPLRVLRLPDGSPERGLSVPELSEIDALLSASLRFVRDQLSR
jgi:sugar phosphate isomerase/epimerase